MPMDAGRQTHLDSWRFPGFRPCLGEPAGRFLASLESRNDQEVPPQWMGRNAITNCSHGKRAPLLHEAVLAQFPIQVPLADSESLRCISAVPLAGCESNSDVGEFRFL